MSTDSSIPQDPGAELSTAAAAAADTAPRTAQQQLHPVVRGIGTASAAVAGVAVLAMFLVMLLEAGSRYLLSDPLGWNVSAVERLMMPGMVFLALPWMYVCAGHVSAEMLYSRMPAGLQGVARIIALLCILIGAALLLAAGLSGVIHAAALGDAPPPGSAEVPIPTWVWLSLQPLGALGLLVVAPIDAPRCLPDGEPADAAEGDHP